MKHPVKPPLKTNGDSAHTFSGCIGPFDPIVFPSTIQIPSSLQAERVYEVQTRVDYEVEVGAVIGKPITWESIQEMDKQQLLDCIAGFVLVSDIKARNPQVMGKFLQLHQKNGNGRTSYQFRHVKLDELLGDWNENICHWWSYAAGFGDYIAIGPFFVSARDLNLQESVGMISARSYKGERSLPCAGSTGNAFALRQCSPATTASNHPDAMLWDLPQIIHSILNPDSNALGFDPHNLQLNTGDIIMLGTPGGTILTGKPQWMVNLLLKVFFWRTPKKWHDWLFERTHSYYLYEGDEVFLYADHLGYQLHRMEKK